MTLSKEDSTDKKKTITKIATIIFFRKYYPPKLVTKTPTLKKVLFF